MSCSKMFVSLLRAYLESQILRDGILPAGYESSEQSHISLGVASDSLRTEGSG